MRAAIRSYEMLADQMTAVNEVRKRKRAQSSLHTGELKSSVCPDLQRAMDLSQEKGASNWLTVLPIEEFHCCSFRVQSTHEARLEH